MHISPSLCVYVYMCMETRFDIMCLLQIALHLIVGLEWLTESGVHWLARLVGQQSVGLLLSPPPTSPHPAFYVGGGTPNSGSLAFRMSTYG